MFYLITFDESDGNDCEVFDAIVEAKTEEEALGLLAKSVDARLVENGVDFEEDGSEFGYFFNCSEDCGEDCHGHGGMGLREVVAYDTLADAGSNKASYHTEWYV